MSQSIMLIDSAVQHRQIIRQFIGKSHPDVQIVEQEPTSIDQVAASVHWSDFDLLLIDNQLGDQDGLKWVEQFKSDQDFPPFIFLSSMDIDSTGANKKAEAGLRLGAQGFLFKRQMKMNSFANQFENYLSAALDDSGMQEMATVKAPFQDTVEPLSDITPSSTPTLKDTFHEMQQAKAMLHGHDHWPFSVQDLQAGKAEFIGYHIQRYLGRRDEMYCFVGQSQSDQQQHVIKLLDQSLLGGSSLPEQLEQDFKKILHWDHPHIVQWIDYKKVDGNVVIIQELIQGEKLSHRLSKTGVTKAQAVTYFMQMMQALSHLHAQGMEAGALSPENLFFRTRDELVLTHFNNIGELLLPSNSPTPQSQRTFHEALYLSPEMIQGQSVDYRSDLYIAAVILYHMMAGKPPYEGNTTRTVLTDQVASPIPLLPDRKHPLNDIIQKLMEKTPAKRLQSADEVLQIMDQLIESGRIAAL